ncbi:hypothetical protein [Saccharopolyspora hattusasensis]|uniref:hypothetical protein n=1 Tax=Saccharopolyspora hattusasensis TaxID=1128679 RepID=UPI003D95D4C6
MSLDLNPTLARIVLRRVAREQIVSKDGLLRHRSDVLPPDVLALLQALHRHGYITLAACSGGPPVAMLSVSGMQLLDWWNQQPTAHPASAPTGKQADGTADTVAGVVTRGPLA